jgi:hypothetical protein
VLQNKKDFYRTFFMQGSSLALRKIILIFLFLAAFLNQAFGTHLRAGQITVRHISDRTVIITIEVWTNTQNTTVLFGGDQDVLDLGDGNSLLVPETQNQAQRPGGPPLPPNVAYASFTYEHTYNAPGVYIISYREPNRNEGVLNMDASVNTTFYLETRIIIDPNIGSNNSPILEVDPIDRACPGVAFRHNPGAHDVDKGDSLSYELVVPFSDRNTTVINYRPPNDASFYTDFAHGDETGTERPTFSINAVDGTLTWDAPGKIGEYNIAFHVVEHRRINGIWRRIGYVRRDMQILVEDCNNERPTLKLPPDTCVIAGTLLEVPIIGDDPDGHQVKIEGFSTIFNNPPTNPRATIDPDPGNANVYVSVPATTDFSWQTVCDHVKDQPYSVVFKITDNPPLGPKLTTFETWFITVVGPKPVWNNYVKNEANRSVQLTWDDYACGNAQSMQVWRKVDGADFEPDNCETGMPAYLGYELIATVPLDHATVSYTDTNNGRGLEAGPKYCYRLVAVFPEATRAESLVSDDLCIEPFDLVDPLITNVDVDITHPTTGKIIVKWVPPQENPNFPPDHNFSYEVWRGEGFTGDSVLVTTTNNLFFEDANLNTDALVYNYTVTAYSDGGLLVGTSSQASSVRLETQARLNRIELNWSATVPWSNNITGLKHVIYRGDEGADTKDDLVKIDEVDVTLDGNLYVDEGQWNGIPLEGGKLYCYLVETYGSYGNPNPNIPDPLINRSQIICTEPGDEEPPCQAQPPSLMEPKDCAKEIATSLKDCTGGNVYTNELQWERVECSEDISHYIIYYSNAENGEYTKVGEVGPGIFVFTHQLNTSYAGCYKISAVDRSGNIGPKSEAFCVDNCPYYELPNVFTPNNDGCNDVFRAYNDKYNNTEGPGSGNNLCPTIPIESQRKCARFVERVEFHVYNRWGQEVFDYSGEYIEGIEETKDAILINWDGTGKEGQQLSTGVYYYIADVTFITVYPQNRNKTLKGWVHLIRGEN